MTMMINELMSNVCGPLSHEGLKPGQRKVLFTCMKRNDKREVKVAQLAGSVAEMSAYHHGEVCSIYFITFINHLLTLKHAHHTHAELYTLNMY